ncbi:MAG: FHA domain-containing protein [Deltaproteobacteria bacterium]|nr:FHA domain-containing protein [Deltaproteobacteria bacterium]
MVTGVARFFVVVRAPNGDVREFPVTELGAVLGRDESADIRVDEKKVSRRHANFRVIDDELWVEDLGSSNGIRLNGRKIDRRARFSGSDQIRVGGYVITPKDAAPATGSAARELSDDLGDSKHSRDAAEQPRLLGLDDPVRGMTFALRSGENILGRLEECDIPILDGSISRQHARLVCGPAGVSVTDLSSSNGTFLNDQRIEVAELAEEDLLRFGNINFRVRFPPALRELHPPRTSPVPHRPRTRWRRWRLAVLGLILVGAVGAIAFVAYWRNLSPSSTDREFFLGLMDGVRDALSMQDQPSDPQPASSGPGSGSGSGSGHADNSDDRSPQSGANDRSSPGDDAGRGRDGHGGGGGARGVGTDDASLTVPPRAGASAGTMMAMSATSTSPYTRRGADGLPLDLPKVDETFDFDRFVVEKLTAARACPKEDFACVRARIAELKVRDPVNRAARALLDEAEAYERAATLKAKAQRFMAKGNHYEAYRAWASIPDSVPLSKTAKSEMEKLRVDAVEDALMKAERLAKKERTWAKAHEMYLFVLLNDATSAEALKGLRSLEGKMRERNMEYTDLQVSPTGVKKLTKPDQIKEEIQRRYGKDAMLARAVQRYVVGDVNGASDLAASAERRGRGAERRRARELNAALLDLREQYTRTRTEIANNPVEAWSRLIEFSRAESRILPPGLKSFLVKELEVSTAEAFADAGESLYELSKFEQAFQRWEAGAKLDRTNPRVLAGLRKLEQLAQKLADEAELATQRGAKDACESWRTITRMTSGDSEIHQRARKRAEQVCRS